MDNALEPQSDAGSKVRTKGILYGVGVGPGDPELLTLKAARILREADVIAIPDTGKGGKTALAIVRGHIEGKERIYCPAPMSGDRHEADEAYDKTAASIAEHLTRGESIAFITIGDPSVYSTYCYLAQRVAAMGYATQTISGITSFCAAAARLGESLCEGAQALHIIPASSMTPEQWRGLSGNKVLMKAGGKLPELTATLAELDADIFAVTNCGMENESIARSAAEIADEAGYFSVIIVKERN